MNADLLTRNFILFLVLPPWVVAGLLDWGCHRKSDIAHTSGLKESLTHALEMTEAAVPVLLGLFFHINALVLLLMTAAFLIHTATGFWDVSYADKVRRISPTEQQCHAALQVLPFCVVSFAVCLHWSEVAAIFDGQPDFSLALEKNNPLSLSVSLVVVLAVGFLLGVPYAEEIWRCSRARREEASASMGSATPLHVRQS